MEQETQNTDNNILSHNRKKSPKLSSAQLVKKLENKGVRFNIINRTEAVRFLVNRNYYFRVTSYESNYKSYIDKNLKYVNLEFAYLVELSTIDMYLREHIMSMCLDIEHCLKVQLLRDIENNTAEDGYDIVDNFLNQTNKAYVIEDIKRKAHSAYCGDLIQHYFKPITVNGKRSFDFPVWAFLEVISFGTFIDFYDFYLGKYKNSKHSFSMLFPYIRSLRNACAHNNCILHDMRPNTKTAPNKMVENYVRKIPNIGKNMRVKKLSNRFNLEFVALLYLFSEIVSDKIWAKKIKNLKVFFNKRLQRSMDFFKTNEIILTNFEFLKKVVDNL